MSTLPERHKKYPLLLGTRDSDFEVFSYPPLDDLYNLGEDNLEPYGFSSVQEYLGYLEERKAKASTEVAELYDQLKIAIVEMNNKEIWSVLLYKGTSEGVWPLRLINGRAYYWPCSETNPVFEGVIDEEEWTSYIYRTKPEDWDILEDPTGMAYRTLYGGNHDQLGRSIDYKHDPIEETDEYKAVVDEVDRLAQEKVDEKVREIEREHPLLGIQIPTSHRFAYEKKKILKEKYGIEWRSVIEMNPGVIFD